MHLDAMLNNNVSDRIEESGLDRVNSLMLLDGIDNYLA